MPRKFNIGFNGRADNAPHDWTQDISLLAARGPDGSIGYRILVGGMQGQTPCLGWHLPVFIYPDQVCGVVLSILRLFHDRGSRSARRNQVRFRFLVEELGADRVLEEIERRSGYSSDAFRRAATASRSQSRVSLDGFRKRQPDHWAVGIAVPMGRLTWQQFEGIAILARDYGDGTMRTALDQNLVLPGVRGA